MQILERTDKISIYLITVLVNWRTIQILVVARTKVDGIFCSEFKYVISFFSLPDEVFKWCVLQYWRKPVPTSSYRQYILCLKGNIGWLSAIVCLWDVSSKCTVIISQHNVTPLGLVPLFHDISALVKSLSFQSLTDRDFLGINLSESLRNAPFKTYYTPYFCRILQDKPPHHHRFQPYDFPGGGNCSEWFPYCFFHFTWLISKCFFLYQLSYRRFNKYPFFVFSITCPGKRICEICWSVALTKFFMTPNLMCRGSKINFLKVDCRSIYYIFLSWNKRFSFRPTFWDVIMFSAPTSPLTQKPTKLCVAKLQDKRHLNHHKQLNYT